MIKLFLTSSPFTGAEEPLNESNRFTERLSECAAECRRALVIASNPADIDRTEEFAFAILRALELSGIVFEDAEVLDNRNKNRAKKLVRASDFIILAGGHVPTQNAFFTEIGLRELMKKFSGTVLGISAGSMNSAEIVYAQPEEEGESLDPEYKRFIRGLGLTKCMLIPHYQDIWDQELDGQLLFEEITCPDSYGKQFIAICDGSYLYSDGMSERICGEAYLIKDGKIEQICGDEEEYSLSL